MRRAVQAVLNLGRLPSESATSESAVFVWEARLTELPLPLTGNEARALADLLGEDYCFGLAWTLIHAIETAGVDVVDVEPDREREPARWSLWRRARNAKSACAVTTWSAPNEHMGSGARCSSTAGRADVRAET